MSKPSEVAKYTELLASQTARGLAQGDYLQGEALHRYRTGVIANVLNALLVEEADAAKAEAYELAAQLHESIDPGCDHEPRGCGAMRAVIQYRDAIRAIANGAK